MKKMWLKAMGSALLLSLGTVLASGSAVADEPLEIEFFQQKGEEGRKVQHYAKRYCDCLDPASSRRSPGNPGNDEQKQDCIDRQGSGYCSDQRRMV